MNCGRDLPVNMILLLLLVRVAAGGLDVLVCRLATAPESMARIVKCIIRDFEIGDMLMLS